MSRPICTALEAGDRVRALQEADARGEPYEFIKGLLAAGDVASAYVAALALEGPRPGPPPGSTGALVSEDFLHYPEGPYTDLDDVGIWHVNFAGGGEVRILSEGGRRFLRAEPAPVHAEEETRAPLITGPRIKAPYSIELELRTVAQLRENHAPNPWETAWVMFALQDEDNFHYFAAKTNGWEFGRQVDNVQDILATGEEVRVEVSERWYRIRLEVFADGVVGASVDGRFVGRISGDPFPAGSIGLYNEDARTDFAAVRLNPLT